MTWEWTITPETKFCVLSEEFACGPFDKARDAHRYMDVCKRNNPRAEWMVKVLHKPREWNEPSEPRGLVG